MKAIRKRPHRGTSDDTSRRLLDAARREFNTRGFWGTDTNRIARVAGFAPQTFYRHFEDKTAIFLAVYESWWQAEAGALSRVAPREEGNAREAARIALAFHTRWRIFRRSLRHLAIEDKRVREARAGARRAQIERAKRASRVQRSDPAWVGALLSAERLCDAAADGELQDLGFGRKDIIRMIEDVMVPLAGG
jgi:AcrR family transcriptional regulator